MSKRRASYGTSRAAEYEDSDVDNLIIMGPQPSSCKKIKMDPNSEDSAGESDEEKGDNEDSPYWKFLETVKNHFRLNGDPMSKAFWKLPSRRSHPDYYKHIKTPMSLNQIKKNIRKGKYGTLSQVADDMNIMFENAKQYNKPTSKLYKDAVKMQKLMQQRVQELLDIVQSSSSDDETLSPVKSQVPRPGGRPTEIAERESNRVESSLPKFDHTNYVTVEDIKPQWIVGSQDVEIKLENSLDDSSLASPATLLSVGGNSNAHNPSMLSATDQERQQTTATTDSTNNKKKPKYVTGYILYSREVRRTIIANNPDSTFGEISRLVGNEWRSLSAAAQQSWAERAARCNVETAVRLADETRQLNDIKPQWTVGSQDVEIKLENSVDDSSLASSATPLSVIGRPTEIAERESNIVESGLRKFDHTNYGTVDEDIKPQWTVGSQDVEIKLENSVDDSSLASSATPLSVIGGNSNAHNPSMLSATDQERQQTTATTDSTNNKKKPKYVTGYILYSREVRRTIIANNPDSTFGQISRIVGNEWRSLSAAAKQSWVERAVRCNVETTAGLAEETRQTNDIKPQWTVGSQDVEIKLENSVDDSSLASSATRLSVIGGNSNPHNPSMSSVTSQERQQTTATTDSTNNKKKPKYVTGYILYSSEVRRSIVNNPGSTFGEISRLVGDEWRSLSAAAKESWAQRAARCNDETAARLADEARQLNVPMEITYECLWDTCDYQFEELEDCTEHCIGESGNTGHVQRHMTSRGAPDAFPCMWRDCARVLKSKPPFPTLTRLLRHVRDLHLDKRNGNFMAHHDRSRNFVASKMSKKFRTRSEFDFKFKFDNRDT